MRPKCHQRAEAAGRALHIKRSTLSPSLATYRLTSGRQKAPSVSGDQGTYRRSRLRCLRRPLVVTLSLSAIDIFQLGELPQSELPTAVSSIFSFASGSARCTITPQLIAKFGASMVAKYVTDLACDGRASSVLYVQDCQQSFHRHRQWSASQT